VATFSQILLTLLSIWAPPGAARRVTPSRSRRSSKPDLLGGDLAAIQRALD
jgi:hypothetical protein